VIVTVLSVEPKPFGPDQLYAMGPEPVAATVKLGEEPGHALLVAGLTVLVKAGQLTSAFGSFPLHYDDADNALLDQPFSYVTYLNLRPDQLPCSGDDIIYGAQYATAVTYHCGGSTAARDGLTPVTLYGLPGVELDLSTIDEQHRRHGSCHDLGNRSQIEHRARSHHGRRCQPTSFVVIELRVSERTLVDDAPIAGDEKHRAGNQRPHRTVYQRIGDRDTARERRIRSTRRAGRDVGAARNDKATQGRSDEKSKLRHPTRKIHACQ